MAPDAAPTVVVTKIEPEHFWIAKLGIGIAQTQRVCNRGARDPIAMGICAAPAEEIRGLATLYPRIGISTEPGPITSISIATASSGLTTRTTSLLRPRLFATTLVEGGNPKAPIAMVAFSRGDRLIEMAGYDEQSKEINFYLLSYELACNANCSSQQLFGASSESAWTSWTLYGEQDLQDTPLDCLTCHRPDGDSGRKRFLMRDIASPWLHWLQSRFEGDNCASGIDQAPLPPLREGFVSLYPQGYGGFPAKLAHFADGHNLHSAILLFGMQNHSDLDEPFHMHSQNIYQQWRCDKANTLWQSYRNDTLFKHGFYPSSYRFDVTKPTDTPLSPQGLENFLKANDAMDAFEIANHFVDREAQTEVGAIASETWDGPTIVTAMCSRCHDQRSPEGSVRAKFKVDAITPTSAATALTRIALPTNSPYAMPPRLSGELGPKATATLAAYLRSIAN
jgi:cytochrome c553